MTWIKICGITNVEDALAAVSAGADALGFVFYEKSPRNIDPGRLRPIVEELPNSVEKVGVFVDDFTRGLLEAALNAGLTAIQYHPRVPPSPKARTLIDLEDLPGPPKLFISLPAQSFFENQETIDQLLAGVSEARFADRRVADGRFDTLLLDSGVPGRPGGTGQAFDWQRAVPVAAAIRRRGLKLVASGGLTDQNVSRAIEILSPWGVDVSSGVEARPGKKDPEKLRAFVNKVRAAPRRAL
jgi:phosphoribosylanthranilate isomerase